jgi:hypothetical protein
VKLGDLEFKDADGQLEIFERRTDDVNLRGLVEAGMYIRVDKANELLRERLEHATIAYGYCPGKIPGYKWLTKGWAGRMGGASHHARLVCVEPINKEEKAP